MSNKHGEKQMSLRFEFSASDGEIEQSVEHPPRLESQSHTAQVFKISDRLGQSTRSINESDDEFRQSQLKKVVNRVKFF